MKPVSSTKQSANDGGDSQWGHVEAVGDRVTGEGGEASGRRWWEREELDKANDQRGEGGDDDGANNNQQS